MNKIIKVLAIPLIVAATSGCVDLRCQEANERIEMHAGATWHVKGPPPPQTANRGSNSRDSVKPKKPRKPRRKPFCKGPEAPTDTGGTISTFSIAGVEKAPEDEYDPNELCLKDLQPAPDGEPKTVTEVENWYLKDREIFLSPTALEVKPHPNTAAPSLQPKSIDLHPANVGLNCIPAGKEEAAGWRCKFRENLTIDAPEGSILEKCVKVPRNNPFWSVNYLGVINERFCIFISVIEEKPLLKRFEPKATNIDKDQLFINVRCHDYSGQLPPGGLVGGPRPNFQ